MNNTDTNTRGEHRSTLKSNPRNPRSTIFGDMEEIMKLLDEITIIRDNKKIRSRR